MIAEYELENRGTGELPVVWSMHPLLALEPGARFEVEGLVSVRVTSVIGLPIAPVPGRADWPETPGTDGRPIALDVDPRDRRRRGPQGIRRLGALRQLGRRDG